MRHDLLRIWGVEETFQDVACGFCDVWPELFSRSRVEGAVHELSMFPPMERRRVGGLQDDARRSTDAHQILPGK